MENVEENNIAIDVFMAENLNDVVKAYLIEYPLESVVIQISKAVYELRIAA